MSDPIAAAIDAANVQTELSISAELARAEDEVNRAAREYLRIEPGTALPPEAVGLLEGLRPLLLRFAQHITNVRTLKALLDAGHLEFHHAGTLERFRSFAGMVHALDEIDDLDRRAGAATALTVKAGELLAGAQGTTNAADAMLAAGMSAAAQAPAVDVVPAPVPHWSTNPATARAATRKAAAFDQVEHSRPGLRYDVYPATVNAHAGETGEPVWSVGVSSFGSGQASAALDQALEFCAANAESGWIILSTFKDEPATVVATVAPGGKVNNSPPPQVADALALLNHDAGASELPGGELRTGLPAPELEPAGASNVTAAETRREAEELAGAAQLTPFRVYAGPSLVDGASPHYCGGTLEDALAYCAGAPGSVWIVCEVTAGGMRRVLATVAADGTVKERGE